MARAFDSSLRPTVLLTAALLVGAAAITIFLLAAEDKPAAANAPLPAAQGMSALSQAQTRMSTVPELVHRVSGDRVAPGTVHRLLSNVGLTGFSLYAWRQAGSDSVCYVSSSAGGGCFAEFIGPFNVSVTDFDRLGSGAPVIVSGPVRDDVVGVEVVVQSKMYDALVLNNVAFLELPDPSISPMAVERITARLSNGKTENVRL